jgi:hypothetical protein
MYPSSNSTSVSWPVIITALVAFISGVLAAVGHHLFYQSLDGKPAPALDERYRIFQGSVSRQEVNVAGGTAFAFLVKAALGTAISTAYVQLFWRALMQSATRKTLSNVATMFSVLSNPVFLFKIWTWWRFPMLLSLAIVAALLPLASILTPATLAVVQRQITPLPTAKLDVPSVGFISLNYVQDMTPPIVNFPRSGPSQYFYNGPSTAVIDIVQAVTVQGVVAPITPPATNTTWDTAFDGPALVCRNVSTQQSLAIRHNIMEANSNGGAHPGICQAYGFLAWTAYGTNQTATLPFQPMYNSSTYSLPEYDGLVSNIPVSLYIAVMPEAMQVVNFGDHSLTLFCEGKVDYSFNSTGDDATFLQCDAVVASYNTTFDYRNGLQAVEVNAEVLNDGAALLPLSSVFGPNQQTGWNGVAPFNASNANLLEQIDVDLLQLLSYQAIVDAFASLIAGSVSLPLNALEPAISTSILNTALAKSPELQFLTQPVGSAANFIYGSLQAGVSASNNTALNSLLTNVVSQPDTSLGLMIEDLFKKIVVSTMSVPELQPNHTSPYAPPKATVTTYAEHNVYVYAASRLWLAYGLAIVCTALAMGLGLFAISANDGTYTADFSTVLRAVQGARLSADMTMTKGDARGPLPSRLARASISLTPISSRGVEARGTPGSGDDGPSMMLLDREVSGCSDTIASEAP